MKSACLNIIAKRCQESLEKDIQMMESILDREPENMHTLFYLACAYETKGVEKAALEMYEKRARLGGFIQEIYFCRLRASYLKGKLNWPSSMVIKSFLETNEMLPSRAEALLYLSDYLCKRGNYLMGYLIVKTVLNFPFPHQHDLVDRAAYRYGRQMQIIESAWRIGRTKETYDAIEEVLAMGDLPDSIVFALQKNRKMKMFDPYRYESTSRGVK